VVGFINRLKGNGLIEGWVLSGVFYALAAVLQVGLISTAGLFALSASEEALDRTFLFG
jgi:hypothetical protein